MAKGAVTMAKKESMYQKSTVTCACGETFETIFTKDKIHVGVFLKFHSF